MGFGTFPPSILPFPSPQCFLLLDKTEKLTVLIIKTIGPAHPSQCYCNCSVSKLEDHLETTSSLSMGSVEMSEQVGNGRAGPGAQVS